MIYRKRAIKVQSAIEISELQLRYKMDVNGMTNINGLHFPKKQIISASHNGPCFQMY